MKLQQKSYQSPRVTDSIPVQGNFLPNLFFSITNRTAMPE